MSQMDEERIRRIVREEIAMALVAITKMANWRYDPISGNDTHNDALAAIGEVVEAVADDMVRVLAGGS